MFFKENNEEIVTKCLSLLVLKKCLFIIINFHDYIDTKLKCAWKVKVLVAKSCETLCDPMDCSLPGSSVRWNSPSKNIGMGSHSLLQDLPDPGIEPGSPALQANSLLSEPLRKPLLITFLHCLLLFIFIVDRCILLSSISWWVSFLKSECKLLYIICSNHVRWYQGLLHRMGGAWTFPGFWEMGSAAVWKSHCVWRICPFTGVPSPVRLTVRDRAQPLLSEACPALCGCFSAGVRIRDEDERVHLSGSPPPPVRGSAATALELLQPVFEADLKILICLVCF